MGTESDYNINETKKISVNMTEEALIEFVFRSYYGRFSGIMTIVLGIIGIVLFAVTFGTARPAASFAYAFVAVGSLIGNPAVLWMKAKKQFRNNPVYREPINYEIGTDGIRIIIGNESEHIGWENIYRLRGSGRMLAVYTGPYHAFVLPYSELGKDKDIVISRIVQFSHKYSPYISGNLRSYLSEGLK